MKFFDIALFNLYRQESTVSGAPIVGMAIISGVANGFLLGIINAAVSAVSSTSLNFRYLLMFAIAMAIFVIGKKFALTRGTIVSENMIRKVRVRISDKIRNSELLFIESLGKAEIYTRLTQDTNLISQSAAIIINACQSAIMLFFCMLYIAYLSKAAFFVSIIAIVAGASLYLYNRETAITELRETMRKETQFFDLLNHILDGFKELKINRRKSNHLFKFFEEIAIAAERLKTKTAVMFVSELTFSQIFFYILIAINIFLLPRLSPSHSELTIRITAAILFIIGPLEMLVQAIPIFTRANVAVENIYELESQLDRAREAAGSQDLKPAVEEERKFFNRIAFESVVFYYCDKDGTPLFTVGPITLSVHRGEIVFVVGGNGSGKSTFLKLLTGLYYPILGGIRLDNEYLGKKTYGAYRELFSIIFTDFHLFDRLYGLEKIDNEKVKELLKLMELSNKTEVIGDVITKTDLSHGQRQRLAMVVALLEDKEIYVFDEWAAGQDPEFKKYFYEVLLRDLRSKGKTIICATHDDRYFDRADRVLKMEFGKFVE